MSLDMRVAILTYDIVEKKRGKWTLEDLKLWLADQGFDLTRSIAKSHNVQTRSFHFVQWIDKN